ncbi:hypothetical protein FALCPG4_001744 [Fusarium falciforme]
MKAVLACGETCSRRRQIEFALGNIRRAFKSCLDVNSKTFWNLEDRGPTSVQQPATKFLRSGTSTPRLLNSGTDRFEPNTKATGFITGIESVVRFAPAQGLARCHRSWGTTNSVLSRPKPSYHGQ